MAAGDPRKDKKFVTMLDQTDNYVTNLVSASLRDRHNLVTNLNQSISREAVRRVKKMKADLERLEGELLMRMDICNEQARSVEKKTRSGRQGRQLALLNGEI